MDISGYISEISKYEPINLRKVDFLFLSRISVGPFNTAYKLFSILKRDEKPMAYKNVNKRVRRLEELNLIKFQKRFKRKAIHYELTTNGLFYLLSNPPFTFMRYQLGVVSYSPKILITYRENIILKTLLYPYFELDTIKNCTSVPSQGAVLLFTSMAEYLSQCYNLTVDGLRRIRIQTTNNKPENFNEWMAGLLEWHAKSFVLKLNLKFGGKYLMLANYEEQWRIANFGAIDDESLFKLLLNDKRFMNFLQSTIEELEAGYKQLRLIR